jgi:hypothetical protein
VTLGQIATSHIECQEELDANSMMNVKNLAKEQLGACMLRMLKER